jgi:tetratricopeptide (TPR) repeat protein
MRTFLFIAALVFLPAFANAQSTEALQVFEKAVAESRRGEHIDALDGFKRTLAIIERDAASEAFASKVHYNIGVTLYHLRMLSESAEHLEKALAYAKNRHARAFYVLGLARLEMNDIENAEESLKSAVVLDNRNGDAWYDLGRAYLALNELDKAKRAFAKALKNGADHRGPEQNTTAAAQTLTAYE